VGPTAKVRSAEAAQELGRRLVEVGRAIGLQVALRITDGLQPVGRGIGPALEARDVLAVLRRQADAPEDLRQRALRLAGDILELGGAAPTGAGLRLATEVLDDGRAWAKFTAICEAQGGLREVPLATHRQVIEAHSAGRVTTVDNRLLSRAAKLAGAPKAAAAGVDVHVRLGETVRRGQPLFTLHAQAPGELAYALQYVASKPAIFQLSEGS
jgi:thymidine phosphorylase